MADKLRNNMDAAEYKHVVLGLIFLKYISDAFEERRAALEADKKSGADPEDPDEYRAENIFWVPKEARWPFLQGKAKQPTIGKHVDDAMVAAIVRIGRAMGIKTVAEHVESRAAADRLAALGVDYAQGYYYAAPAIVHQGGVGTIAQAMRAGRPMLVVPFAHDQYDHAARLTRRGIGLTLERGRYTEARATARLRRLLEDPSFAARAAEIGARVRAEHGALRAAEAIEQVLAHDLPQDPFK